MSNSEMSRRNFLRLTAAGAAAVGLASLDLQTASGQAAEQTTTTETTPPTEYQQQLAAAVTHLVIDARTRAETAVAAATPENPASLESRLLAQVTHWEAVTALISFFADTYMINGDATQIEDQLKNWNDGFTLRFAVLIDRVVAKLEQQLGTSVSPEVGYTGQSWDENLSPLRKLLLYLVDLQSGKQIDVLDDKLSDEETVKDAVFKVLIYILTKLDNQTLAGFSRGLQTEKEKNKPDTIPRPIIGAEETYDLDGLINFINSEVFNREAATEYTKPTDEHVSLSARIYDFFTGRRLQKPATSNTEPQQIITHVSQNETRLALAESIKKDLTTLLIE